MELTQDFLRHVIHYDPLTGKWTWVNPHPQSKFRRGDPAGRTNQQGRVQLHIYGKFYYSGRLAWFYMTGVWPEEQIDHINRIRDDDRWENLREASQSQNSYNRGWCEQSGDWRGIRCNGNRYAVSIGGTYLGNFETFEEAKAVRDQALSDWAGPFALPHKKEAS